MEVMDAVVPSAETESSEMEETHIPLDEMNEIPEPTVEVTYEEDDPVVEGDFEITRSRRKTVRTSYKIQEVCNLFNKFNFEHFYC